MNFRDKPLTLLDLDASFLIFTKQKGVLKTTKDRDKAQGLYFLCPNSECRKRAKAGEAPHAYTLLFHGAEVPEAAKPPGRWTPIGEGLGDLALLEIIRGTCGWRGCIRGGEIVSTLS